MEKHLIEIKNQLTELERLATTIETLGEQWNLPMNFCLSLNLVLEELVTNIIFYGFPQGGEHLIQIEFMLDKTTLQLTVIDDGIAFNPLSKEDPDLNASVEDRAIGGLGIHFVKTIMDSVRYERSNKKNVLIMTKSVAV